MIAGFALATAVVVMSLIAVAKFAAPFVWVAAFWSSALLIGIKLTKRSNLRALCFNLAIVVIAVGGYEAWLYANRRPAQRHLFRDTAGQPQSLSEVDDILGYSPVKGQSGSWKRFVGDDLVFDMEYSIDSAGLRSAPPGNASPETPCVLFFGGSYTFGSGVNDDETTAYQVGVKSGGTFRTYNFGHAGYGPHQMLAALEQGRVDDVINCQPRYAVYQVIKDHVRRAAGPSSWDTRGPRFVLLSDTSVIQDGTFEPPRGTPLDGLKEYLNRSLVIQRLGLFGPRIDKESVSLFVAVVNQARTVFEEQYAGSEFHVIFWPNDHWSGTASLEGLQAAALNVHVISDILPGYSRDEVRYKVHPRDAHPSALAHSIIADYVLREIAGYRSVVSDSATAATDRPD